MKHLLPRQVALPVAWLTLLSGLALATMRADPSALVANTLEDGAFYVQIAKNIALGRGVTFDGQTPTIGVHWAWQFVLTAGLLVVPYEWLSDPIAVLRVASFLYLTLLGVAGFGVTVALRVAYPGRAWLPDAAGLAFVLIGLPHEYWLMESHLVFLALALMLAAAGSGKRGVAGYTAALGAGWLLTFTRLDLILVVAGFLMLETAWDVLQLTGRGLQTTVARLVEPDRLGLAIGALAGVACVAAVNLAVDGRPVSVSTAIKIGGDLNDPAYIAVALGPLLRYYPADFLITVLFGLGWIGWRWRPWQSGSADAPAYQAAHAFLAAGGYTGVHLLLNHGVDGWYLAPLRLTAFVLAVTAGLDIAAIVRAGGLLPKVRRYAPAMAIAPLLAVTLGTGLLTERLSQSRHWTYERLAPDITALVPPGERVYMEDLSGRLALLTGRDFVSGDGLVNSHHYLHEHLLPGQVGKYLDEEEIDYFLSSNIACDGRRDPWTRDVEHIDVAGQHFVRFVIDISYLTSLDMTPSVLAFPSGQVLLDRCDDGIRNMLVQTHTESE